MAMLAHFISCKMLHFWSHKTCNHANYATMLSSCCCHGDNRDFLKLVTSFVIRGYTLRVPAYMVEFTRAHADLAIKEKPSYLALLEGSSSLALGRLRPFFLGLLFPPLSVHKTSKITRSKAAVPGGGTFSNLPAAHSWTLSHLKALREICSALYSFHNNVRNKCRKMRNKALCYVSLRRKLHRRISGLKLNGTQGLLSRSTCAVRCTLRC